MVVRAECPRCGETDYKKNGQTHYGKQTYQCRRCARAFIVEVDRETVSEEKQKQVRRQWREDRRMLRNWHLILAFATVHDRGPRTLDNKVAEVPTESHWYVALIVLERDFADG